MKSSVHLVLTLFVSFLLSTHNALASPRPKKRMSNSYSDTTNIYKHEVLITTQSKSCTGSILSNWHVLTAAHCVIQRGSNLGISELIEVTVGITEIDNEYEFQTTRLVETIYTPSHFVSPPVNSSDEVYEKNIGDIALLKLNYGLGLGFDPRIEAMKVPYQEYESIQSTMSNKLTFTGFGLIAPPHRDNDVDSEEWLPGQSPTHLQYSSAQAQPSNSCSTLGNSQLKMCAKLDNPQARVCHGDSGGPLFTEDGTGKIIYGVASYGEDDCDDTEGYYTRVFPYSPFITNAARDQLDGSILRQSYKFNAVYQKHLKENRFRYFWIYAPDVMKQSQYPENNKV